MLITRDNPFHCGIKERNGGKEKNVDLGFKVKIE